MPAPARVGKDIERGRAKWEFDSRGERYLSYQDGRTFHRDLHSAGPRSTQLYQAKSLGLTQKNATLIERDVRVLGLKLGTKKEVLISRETGLQRQAGRDRDELRERMRDPQRSAAGRAWARAQDNIYRNLNAEGWRKATLQESVRAKLSIAREGAALRNETRERLEKVAAAAKPAPTTTPAAAAAKPGKEIEHER